MLTRHVSHHIAGTGRIACVDLPALPLQLLLRAHPHWQGPAAVVAEDSPQAPLLWLNEAARRSGLLPGMRYAAALSIDRHLQAGTVAEAQVTATCGRLHRHLLRYSPRVEPARHEPGVFWLDAGGLERVGGPLRNWTGRLSAGLRRAGWIAGVTVGFTRFGTYCLARCHRQVQILESPDQERAIYGRVPLARLELPPRLRDDLAKLGVGTVADLTALPVTGLAARFGPETLELVQLAKGLRHDPLQPVVPPAPLRSEEVFDDPETDAWRLLFVIKRLLHPLLDRLADGRQAIALLHCELRLDDRARTCRRETLQPAAPTLDAVLLMELVRLRLETLELAAGVERVILQADGVDAPPEALELFRRRLRRDPAAALRAVARLKAELGDDAVVTARLHPAHLPEATFSWQPVTRLTAPVPRQPQRPETRPLVRRLLPRPRPLLAGAADLAHKDGGQLLRAAAGPGGGGIDYGRIQAHGPHLLSDGWWAGETRRVYHFLESEHGPLVWVFFDERRRRWFLQGKVE